MDLAPIMNYVVISAQSDHQWSYCTGAHGDDGDITAGTCSRDRICTVIYRVSQKPMSKLLLVIPHP